MILASMSLEERQAQCREVHHLLKRVAASGNIAGGYARDTFMGRDASDIDLWIPIRYYPEKARRLQLVQQLGDALGQYGFRQAGQGRTTDEMLEDLMRPSALNWDAAPAEPYAGVNLTGIEEAYELIHGGVNLAGYNPLQVIFCDKPSTTGIHSNFHVNLSKFYTNDEGEAVASISALRDSANRTLTIQDTRGLRPEVFLRYLQKMKLKFPDFNVNIAIPVTDESFNPLYQALFNGGVLNGSRQVLSTQGQGASRDNLGLTNGTGAAPTARRTPATRVTYDELAVPSTATFVYDEARVQPRFSTEEALTWVMASRG